MSKQIVVAALIERDGKYFVARRSDEAKYLPGKWEFPGGKVNTDETEEAALEREITEEFNTLVRVSKLIAKTDINDSLVLHLYKCTHHLGAYRLSVHSDSDWLTLNEIALLDDLAPADIRLLEQIIKMKHSVGPAQSVAQKTSNWFKGRKELYLAGFHDSYQRGIGRAKDGSGNVSIVLSGGYKDDQDFGDEIIYTGEGGRDEKTGAQIQDQVVVRGNKNLVAAFEAGEPVYVTRGHRHESKFSPSEGYEFAGIYYISQHWIETGVDGFNIIRFKLVRERSYMDVPTTKPDDTRRVKVTSMRVVRETKVAKRIKEMYDYACQVCGEVIDLPTGGRYAEGAHIKPLGRPHDGPDVIENLLCLCPNHHLMFDKYCYSIDPETLELVGIGDELKVVNDHKIDRNLLAYHFDNYTTHRA